MIRLSECRRDRTAECTATTASDYERLGVCAPLRTAKLRRHLVVGFKVDDVRLIR